MPYSEPMGLDTKIKPLHVSISEKEKSVVILNWANYVINVDIGFLNPTNVGIDIIIKS